MRRRRWALMIVVPMLLLGAALVVRSRLSRPVTPTDAYLWDLGEEATTLIVYHIPSNPIDVQGNVAKGSIWVQTTDKKGIREVLRSFENTGAIQRASDRVASSGKEARPHLDRSSPTPYWAISIHRRDKTYLLLALTELRAGNRLYLGDLHGESFITNDSLQNFHTALARVINRAKHGEPGYEGRYEARRR